MLYRYIGNFRASVINTVIVHALVYSIAIKLLQKAEVRWEAAKQNWIQEIVGDYHRRKAANWSVGIYIRDLYVSIITSKLVKTLKKALHRHSSSAQWITVDPEPSLDDTSLGFPSIIAFTTSAWPFFTANMNGLTSELSETSESAPL